MNSRLLITSGRGPGECRLALQKVLRTLKAEAAKADIGITEIPGPAHSQGHGPSSVVVVLEGDDVAALVASWVGTVQWIAQSPLRPNHKRKNWFVAISEVPPPPEPEIIRVEDVRIDAFRAGGPGGQHVNVTESAVRITHTPTGTQAIAREERSQHRNRAVALERLAEILALRAAMARGALQDEAQQLHDSLIRGNPIRVIRD